MSTRKGEKAEIWLCNKCGRAIFFDDGGLYVTRYMRPAEPAEFSQCDEPVKAGVFYNDKVFFDADGISDASLAAMAFEQGGYGCAKAFRHFC